MPLAFALGPAELALLFVVIPVFVILPLWFIYRAGKNAGRAEAMKEQLERDNGSPRV